MSEESKAENRETNRAPRLQGLPRNTPSLKRELDRSRRPSTTEQQQQADLAEQAGRVINLVMINGEEWEEVNCGEVSETLFDKHDTRLVELAKVDAPAPGCPGIPSSISSPAAPRGAKPRSAGSSSTIGSGGSGGSGSGGSGGGGESRASMHSYGLAASGRAAWPSMPAPLPEPPPPPPSFVCCYLNGRCDAVAPLLLRIDLPRDLPSLLAQA